MPFTVGSSHGVRWDCAELCFLQIPPGSPPLLPATSPKKDLIPGLTRDTVPSRGRWAFSLAEPPAGQQCGLGTIWETAWEFSVTYSQVTLLTDEERVSVGDRGADHMWPMGALILLALPPLSSCTLEVDS